MPRPARPHMARTTTALIASLSLMVPSFGQVALAQDSAALEALLPAAPLDGDTAAALNAEQARFQPELSAALATELAAGLTPEMLTCADGAAAPCAPEVPLVTPSGIAVELAANGTFVLLPAEMQEKAVEMTGLTPAHAAEKAGLEAEQAKAAEEAAKIEAEAAKEAEKAAEAAAKEAEKAAEAEAKAAEAAAKEAAQQADAETKAAEQAAAEAAKQAEQQAAADAKAAEEAAKAAEKQAEAEAKAAQEAAKVAEEQAASEAKAAAQASEEAQKKAAEDIAKAKAATDSAGAAALNAVTGQPAAEPAPAPAAAPVDTPVVEAPKPAAPTAAVEAPKAAVPATAAPADKAKELAEALAAEQAAQAGAPAIPVATPEAKAETTIEDLTKVLEAEGKAADPTVQPEAVAIETEAAKAAAAASDAPVAAALQALGAKPVAATDAAAPAVEEVKVTEDAARSSAQDFDTSVAEAARKAAEQLSQPAAEAASKADSGLSDIEKLAIAGLGALAVGTMLNNNRRVSLNTGDRIVVTRPDGSQEVIKDENVLLFRPGNDVRTETFDDGSTRTIVTREDGSQIVTVRDAELRVLKRVKVMPDGTEYALIDETEAVTPVQVNLLPDAAPAYIPPTGGWDEAAVREALARETAVDRTFTLNQVRNIPEVRALVAPVEIEAVTFDTGSAAIRPDQARALALLGTAMQDRIAKNPREMFLIEGHTDTVGQAGMNLALSDRRAESVALALTEYFDIPPENMVVQGYGEQFLKVREAGDIRANRRAAVRRITDLLQTAANN